MPDIAVDLPPCAHAAKQIPIPALADRPEPVFEGDSSSDSASDVDAPRLPDEPAVRQTSSEKTQHEPEPTLVPLPSGTDASPSDGGSVASWQCVAEASPVVDEADEYIFLFNPFSKVVHVARSCELDDPLCQYVPVTISSLDKGLRGVLLDGSLQKLESVPRGVRLCLKFGCGRDPLVRQALGIESDCVGI